jgi:hypothetical protein
MNKWFFWIWKPLLVRHLFQRTQAFWRWRRRLLIAEGQLIRRYLRGRYRAAGTVLASRLMFSLTKSIAAAALLAITIIAIAYGAESALRTRGLWFPKNWSDALGLQREAYTSVLSTIAQVTGVFLGLYFTAVSAVASSAYSRVPNTVRSLVLEEKLGNVYVRLVALEAALATILLSAQAIGLFLGYVNFGIVAVGAILSIFAFVALGFRVFYFFDPTQLVGYVERDLQTAIVNVTVPRRGSMLAPLQAGYQAQAARALSSYADLVAVATQSDQVETEAANQLAQSVCRSLRFYGRYKNNIPSESLWFTREYRHPDWFSTDYSALSLALETGTSLQPKEVPDLQWCEKELVDLLEKLANALVRAGNVQTLTSLAVWLSHTAFSAALHMPNDLIQVSRNFLSTFSGNYEALPQQIQISRGHQQLLNLATAQSYIPTSILLGFAHYCLDESQQAYHNSIQKINWRNQGSLYQGFPRPVTKELEQLWVELAAERKIERTSFLPDWFARERTNLQCAEFLRECVMEFIGALGWFFIEGATQNAKTLVCAPIVQAGLEYADKLLTHIVTARQWFEQLTAEPSKEELGSPVVDWDELAERIKFGRDRLLTMLADIAGELRNLPIEEYPDYFGQLYSFLAQECYQAIAAAAETRFAILFPRFFDVALHSSQRIATQIASSSETKLILITDPINDLLELSGFALIYAELDGKQRHADVVKNAWDNYLQSLNEPERTTKLRMFASWQRPLLHNTPREMVRMGWKQHLSRVFRSRGLVDEMWNRRPARIHSSALIRAVTRNAFVLDHASDVFILEYLVKQPELISFEFQDRRIRALQRDIEAERNGNTDADE